MSTAYLRKMKEKENARPGALLSRARTWAIRVFVFFAILFSIALGMILFGIWIPGQAFLRG